MTPLMVQGETLSDTSGEALWFDGWDDMVENIVGIGGGFPEQSLGIVGFPVQGMSVVDEHSRNRGMP